jgi:hypothetical protein
MMISNLMNFDLPTFEKLHPLSLNDYPYISSMMANLNQPISHYSFSVMYGYAELLNLSWIMCHKHLCIFMIDEGYLHLFIPPLPEANATTQDLRKALLTCFEIMQSYNIEQGNAFAGKINAISDELLDRINACAIDGWIVTDYPMGKDYIYDIQKMITLSGPPLSSKRQERNKFVRTYPNHHTVAMSDAHTPSCLALLKKWDNVSRKYQETTDQIYQKEEVKACERIIQNWQDLHLKGMLLIVNEELAGFTFGEALSPTQAHILIEKTDPDFKNAPAYIFSEFCRQYWSEQKECNAAEDGNQPNLRFTKELYRPIMLLNKYSMVQKAYLKIPECIGN